MRPLALPRPSITLAVLIPATAAVAFWVTRSLRRAIFIQESERTQRRAASEALSHRNQQLTALYNVFTEITETLSLHYVVSATLRETLKLMNADMAVLRGLRGEELQMLGAQTSDGREIEGLLPVRLGEGPTGRVARRGRLLRLDVDAEKLMSTRSRDVGLSPSQQTGAPMLESGIIAPLIVGARVVGTLACWSYKQSAYDADDERIVEMLASQVATAIVAADSMENSERRAHHDPLTDLPNRRQLNEDLAALAALAGNGRQAVVAMVDIDHFKHFNDEYGHRVGDVTLQKVASVLRNAVREGDFVYRYGGEEFVVIFPDAGSKEACALAERVRSAVEATPLTGDQLEPVGPITISIGLAVLPEHGPDISTLIELADAAMYEAKEAGRNRVVLRQSPLSREAAA